MLVSGQFVVVRGGAQSWVLAEDVAVAAVRTRPACVTSASRFDTRAIRAWRSLSVEVALDRALAGRRAPG